MVLFGFNAVNGACLLNKLRTGAGNSRTRCRSLARTRCFRHRWRCVCAVNLHSMFGLSGLWVVEEQGACMLPSMLA